MISLGGLLFSEGKQRSKQDLEERGGREEGLKRVEGERTAIEM